MAKKEYEWRLGEPPPRIDAHSFAKHRVYEEYLSHYLQVSYSNPQIPSANLSIVDAFAGGGEYFNPVDNSLYEGSPLRLLYAADSAVAAINTKRKEAGVRTQFRLGLYPYFVEKDKYAFEYLRDILKRNKCARKYAGNTRLINDAFENKLDVIVDDIKSRQRTGRSIFILDQYGWSQVPFSSIRLIFRELSKAEVILTFATEWMIDYLSSDKRFATAYKKTGLQDVLSLDSLLENKKGNPHWKGVIQYHLHSSIQALSGARYYTPFFIKSNEANRSFWLLHLSNHPRARDVMTSLHWRIKNQFSHHLGHGISMFGYDPGKDALITGTSDLFCAEYSFDDEARQSTIDAVLGELPKMVFNYPDGITFSDFYILVANQTPATTQLLKEVLEVLVSCKEIIVKSQNGNNRSRASTIKDSDVIRMPRQLFFDLA